MKRCTYRFKNEKTREEVEDGVETRGDNCGNLVVWREGNSHHTIVGEVQEAEAHDESVIEELCSCPLEVYHGICNQRVRNSLNQAIWKFYQYLQKQTKTSHHKVTPEKYHPEQGTSQQYNR